MTFDCGCMLAISLYWQPNLNRFCQAAIFTSRVSEIRALESAQSSSRKNLDALFNPCCIGLFRGSCECAGKKWF
jgi:hypothetical protein